MNNLNNLTVIGFANKRTTMDKVVEELQPPNGKVLHTSLFEADEASLKAAVGKVKAERV